MQETQVWSLDWEDPLGEKNNLTLHLKQLEKEKQTKPKVSRKKEIIK